MKGSGGIATHVKPKGKFTLAIKLKDQCADSFTAATVKEFLLLPNKWKKTLTVDNEGNYRDLKTSNPRPE
jgi:IS30 family transposase